MNPLIDDYLKQKFGDDYQAKAQSDYDDRSNNINTGSFVSSIGDALAGRAPGSQNDNFNAMKKQAKEDTIGKVETAKKDYMTNQTFDNEQKVAQQKNESFDPMSQQSQTVQQTVKRLWPNKFTDEQISKITAANADLVYKPMELMAKIDANKEATAARIDAKKSADETKTTEKQRQSFISTSQLLEQMRGAPGAAQAEKDLYAADKARTLMQKFSNPNPQMTKLLVSEIAKIASGGQSSQHELDGLTPSTLSGDLASAWQKVSNEPSPANAQAFLKDYMTYANGISNDAQKTIQDRYGRIIESRKSLLSPDHLRALQDSYINRFKAPEAAGQAPGGKSPVKKEFNQGQNKTRITYSDGSTEVLDGRQ